MQTALGPGYSANLASVVIANCLIIGIAIFAAALYTLDLDIYYLSVQEDQYPEWATFWAFTGAGSMYLVAGLRLARTGESYWFALLVGAYCLLIGLEEISWGQRIIGYRPPAFFLEGNYQQEFNLHNVLATDLRKLGLMTTILGFGIVLPLLVRIPGFKRFTGSLAAVSPPIGLAPAFLAAYILYLVYPWKSSGEWVELMLGLGFLFSAQRCLAAVTSSGADEKPPPGTTRVVGLWLIVFVAGIVSAAITNSQWLDHGQRSVAVQKEIAALSADFQANSNDLQCNAHKRLYTYVEQRDQVFLLDGHFAGLVDGGLSRKRAEFFLDPWNSPYWIRDSCGSDASNRSAFVYSLGPNRRRDSTRAEIRSDDVGAYIFGGRPTR